MRKYLCLTKGSILESLSFRTSAFVSVIGNVIYLIIIYYLWKAIYASSPTDMVNGMTFYDTMIYLVLASALFQFMNCFVIWDIARSFQSGLIVLDLLKPMDYQMFLYFKALGTQFINFFLSFAPTFIIVCFIAKGNLSLGLNLLYFVLSVILGTMINFAIDFFVGTMCLHTQSVWGINNMKEVIVALMSGAAIPLAFFPKGLRKIVNFFPFQAIYNIPLQILIDHNLNISDYFHLLGKQILWLIFMLFISRMFWKSAKRVITING